MNLQDATQRDVLEYDVVIVGAGPAGLALGCTVVHISAE